MSHILALDIGTSSVRAALYDFSGSVLPETVVKNSRTIDFTKDGGAEIDAEEAFAQVVAAIENVFEKTDLSIDYVAVSCFWHSLIGIDSDAKATTPVYTWAETRPAPFVEILRKNLDEKAVHNRTGARFHSSFWTAKLLWLKRDFPEVFQNTKRWLSFSDFLAKRLFGEAVTSFSMASGTGILDIRRSDWDAELCSFLHIGDEKLSRIAQDGETFQTTRWDRLKNAKWFLAIGDGAANNIGAGCLEKTKAALMIGTSGAMRVGYEGDAPREIPAGLWCYCIDKKRLIVGGALSDGGGLYAWLKETMKISDEDDDVEAEIAKRAPASHGLTFLPFLAGERSTGYHENAKGAILGLTQNTTAVDITQAAMESVAFRFANIVGELEEISELKTIIASGGALRESPVWTQIIADVLGKNLTLPDTREASSRGAVLLALENLEKISDISKLPTPDGAKFYFDEKQHQIYAEERKKHEYFYQKIIATMPTSDFS